MNIYKGFCLLAISTLFLCSFNSFAKKPARTAGELMGSHKNPTHPKPAKRSPAAPKKAVAAKGAPKKK